MADVDLELKEHKNACCHCEPSGKDHWNQWSPYNLTLLQLEQTTGSSGQRGTGPLTEPGFSQGFFLRSVTDGVLVPSRCRLWLA